MAAMKSPCKRRKYGAVIFFVHKEGIEILAEECNSRVSSACDYRCIRDALYLEPVTNVEIGAEVHAEQAALIKTGMRTDSRKQLFLVGLTIEGREIYSPKPCYTCLRMIVFAGYKSIYTFDGEQYQAKSVAEYMEEYDFIHAPDA